MELEEGEERKERGEQKIENYRKKHVPRGSIGTKRGRRKIQIKKYP
jgi:hypothetical protein